MSKGPSARAVAVPLVTTANTTVLTMNAPLNIGNLPPGITAPGPNTTISGELNITTGASTTSVNIQCVDNTGAQVGTTHNETIGAAVSADIPFSFSDVTDVNRNSYSIKVAQVAASTNGTVNEIVGSVSTDG